MSTSYIETINLEAERLNVRVHEGDSFSKKCNANWDLSGVNVTAELATKDGEKIEDFVVTSPTQSVEDPNLWEFIISLEEEVGPGPTSTT